MHTHPSFQEVFASIDGRDLQARHDEPAEQIHVR